MSPLAKISLANLPTPLLRYDALDALVGTRVWVKRDDMSAGPEAGNKIRKLEYLLADALARKARTVITCGGVQSNHARATTLLARLNSASNDCVESSGHACAPCNEPQVSATARYSRTCTGDSASHWLNAS